MRRWLRRGGGGVLPSACSAHRSEAELKIRPVAGAGSAAVVSLVLALRPGDECVPKTVLVCDGSPARRRR